MISAVVFTGYPEEEEYLPVVLETISFADQIVVIENGITDSAKDKIKKYTKEIYHEGSKDFALRHNLGKEKAKGEWILYIDADERVSSRLKDEIIATVKNPKCDAYQLNRVNYFLAKKVRYGDRFPDNVTRLFKKEKLIGWVGKIHESSRVDGAIGKLEAPLYHITHRDIHSMIRKTIIFSESEADLRLDSNHPPIVWWRLIRVFLTEFYNRIVRLQGWRQGTEGWIDGIFQAFSLFVVYARLWEKQRKPSLDETYKLLDKEILEGKL